MAKAASKTSKKSTKSDAPDDPEIEEVETENGEDEPETPPENLPPAEGAADEPVPPPAGSSAVTLRGEGTLSILFDGEIHNLERGKKIKIPADLATALAGEIEEEK